MILEDNNFERAYESVAGDKYKLLKNYIPDEGIGVFSKSWIVGKLFDQDVKVIELVKDNVDESKCKEIEDILRGIKNGNLITGNCKFDWIDRKSTRLNSSHGSISYAVFCLKKKKKA